MTRGRQWPLRKPLCYTCLIFILWDVLQRLGLHGTAQIGSLLLFIEALMAGAMLTQLDLRRYRFTWPLLLFFPLVIVLCILRGWEPLDGSMSSLQRGLFVFIDVAMLGLLMDRDEIRRWLKLFIALWTLWYAGCALVGVWSAFTETPIHNLDGTKVIELSHIFHRMTVFVYFTITGEEFASAILLAVVGAALTQRRIGKVLYLLTIPPMALILALTDARSSIASLSVGTGVLTAILIIHRLGQNKKAAATLIAVCAALAVMVASYFAATGLISGFNAVHTSANQQLRFIAVANSEGEADTALTTAPTPEPVVAIHRTSSLLSGRQYIWLSGLTALKEHPGFLLLGGSIPHVMETCNQYVTNMGRQIPEHLHNIALQALLELGLGGLALVVWYLALFLLAAFRFVYAPGYVLWEKLLIAPAACLLANEMVECITKLSLGNPTGSLLMLLTGTVLTLDAYHRSQEGQPQP